MSTKNDDTKGSAVVGEVDGVVDEITRLRGEIQSMNDTLREVEERAERLLRARNAMAVRCAQLQLEMAELRREVEVEAERASA